MVKSQPEYVNVLQFVYFISKDPTLTSLNVYMKAQTDRYELWHAKK